MRGHDFTAKFTARFSQQENPQFGGGWDSDWRAVAKTTLGTKL
jgi:hypothetical protein